MPEKTKSNIFDKIPKTVRTNYKGLILARVVPSFIKVEGYRPYHVVNLGHHTKIVPTAENILTVCKNPKLGRGFVFNLKSDSKGGSWKGWLDLAELEMEIVDFRCLVCGRNHINMVSEEIRNCLLPHMNQNRRKTSDVGYFGVTFAPPYAQVQEEVTTIEPETIEL